MSTAASAAGDRSRRRYRTRDPRGRVASSGAGFGSSAARRKWLSLWRLGDGGARRANIGVWAESGPYLTGGVEILSNDEGFMDFLYGKYNQ